VVTQGRESGRVRPKRSGLKRDGLVAEGNQAGCSWEKAAGRERGRSMEVRGKLQRSACRLVVHVMQKVGSLDGSRMRAVVAVAGPDGTRWMDRAHLIGCPTGTTPVHQDQRCPKRVATLQTITNLEPLAALTLAGSAPRVAVVGPLAYGRVKQVRFLQPPSPGCNVLALSCYPVDLSLLG
jgi:hypothetical protein